LTYSVTGLTTNRYYTFAVTAVNVVGESSRATSAAIITATVPGQPSTPSLISQSKTSINIGWSNPINTGGTSLTGFIIEMDSGTRESPGVFRTMQI
jgi:titin